MQISKISPPPARKNQNRQAQLGFKGTITIVPLNKEMAAKAFNALISTAPALKQSAQAYRKLGCDDYSYFFVTRFKKGYERCAALFLDPQKVSTQAIEEAAENLDSIALFTNTKCGKWSPNERDLMEKFLVKGVLFKYNDFKNEGEGRLISEVPKYKNMLAEIFAAQ